MSAIAILCILAIVLSITVFMVWASASIRSGVYVRAFCREKTDRKVVYLTFDDGPHPPETERVLDVLREHGARATFFLIGSKVSGNEAVLRRMLEEGHALGLHTYSHAGTFPLLSFDKMLADVNEGKRAVESVAGKKISLFRPPFGVTNPTIAKVIRTLGLQTVGWDVRSFDTMFCKSSEHSCKQSVYSFKQSEHSCKQSGHSCKQSGHDWYVPVVERIMKQVRPGSVILLHDRLDGASELLSLLLDSLAASGYDFTRALPNTLISSSDSSETNLS
ncbi:MAG: polysaccharide deacetylase family protein [Bacteroidales bacterium]|jgi:peptidoglycan/xylan/chitin deacetylase (PgdA/CDA1 family)|nr:polysaccharide deacetylase family protein [Bacteroidales bacterium]